MSSSLLNSSPIKLLMSCTYLSSSHRSPTHAIQICSHNCMQALSHTALTHIHMHLEACAPLSDQHTQGFTFRGDARSTLSAVPHWFSTDINVYKWFMNTLWKIIFHRRAFHSALHRNTASKNAFCRLLLASCRFPQQTSAFVFAGSIQQM